MAGHSAAPPTTRLRCNGRWLTNDAQTLADAGVAEGGVVFVATPRERNSREELSVSVREVGGGNEQVSEVAKQVGACVRKASVLTD